MRGTQVPSPRRRGSVWAVSPEEQVCDAEARPHRPSPPGEGVTTGHIARMRPSSLRLTFYVLRFTFYNSRFTFYEHVRRCCTPTFRAEWRLITMPTRSERLPSLILFEDDDLLVIHKPAGWNTHAPTPFSGEGVYD